MGDVEFFGDKVDGRTGVEIVVKIVKVGNHVRIAGNRDALIEAKLHLGEEGKGGSEDAEEQEMSKRIKTKQRTFSSDACRSAVD